VARRERGRREVREALADGGQDGAARRHDGGLGVRGQGQLLLRPLEDETREPLAQGLVDALEDGTRGGGRLQDVPAHADRLRALTREQPRDAHWSRLASLARARL
jgi:hypothetical protein